MFLTNTARWILGMVVLAIGIGLYLQVKSIFDDLMLGSLAIIIIILGALLLILGLFQPVIEEPVIEEPVIEEQIPSMELPRSTPNQPITIKNYRKPWKLSPEESERVNVAKEKGNEQECLSEKYGICVTRGDLHTLAKTAWLNDQVINFYFKLISECRSLKVHVFNSFFYDKLSQSGGYKDVRKWTKKVKVFDHDLILIPVHLGTHWCLAAIDFKSQQFLYYDSLSGTNTTCHKTLRGYLQSESLDKLNVPLDLHEWTNQTPRDIPQQTNSSDCGVFICMYARHKAYMKHFTFSQGDMTDIRKFMIMEILERKLVVT